MIDEYVITMQISGQECPKCESDLKGRKREDAKNKASSLKWNKHIAWKVKSDPDDFHRGTQYYHFDCYIPQTQFGIEQKEFWTLFLTGRKLDKKTVDEITEEETPTGLFGNIAENRKTEQMLEEIDEESDALDGMNWPLQQQIEISLDHPEKNMEDDELKKIKMVYRPSPDEDLLLHYPGNFAIVYQGKCENSMFALKLFKKQKKGLIRRYQTLHNYFKKNKIFTKCSYFSNITK